MKHKNILLSFGTLATVVAPISTIIACGDNEKSVTEKDLKTEIDKLQNFTTSHDVAHVGDVHVIDFTKFTNKTRDIMAEYKTIAGVDQVTKGLSADLSDGITISKVVLKTAYDSSTHRVVFTVTLAQGTNKVKNNMRHITVTFAEDLIVEKSKLQNFTTSTDITSIGPRSDKVDFTSFNDASQDIVEKYKSILGAENTNQGLTEALAEGIEISKVVLKTKYNTATFEIVFTVTLAKGKDRVTNNVKDIIVTFATDLTLERNKLQNFISSYDIVDNKIADDSEDSSGADVNIIDFEDTERDIVEEYKAITGVEANGKGLTEALTQGIEISKVVLKTAYDSSTHKIVFTVTLGKDDDVVINNVKDITITFAEDLKLEKAKLKDHFISQVDVTDLGNANNNYNFTAAIINDEINLATQYKLILEWNQVGTSIGGDADESKGVTGALTSGITISKVVLKKIYDSSTHKIVFTVTLGQSDKVRFINNVKEVTVTFAEDLKLEKAKLKDHFISQADVTDLGSANYNFKTAIVDSENIAEQYKLIPERNQVGPSIGDDADESKGITGALTGGITISKVVLKKVYDSSTHKIVFTVTLAKSTDRVTNNVKEVTVTFAQDLKLEKAKLQDFASTDLVSNGAHDFTNMIVGMTDVSEKFKTIAGASPKYLSSSLTGGIAISKVVLKKVYDSSTHKIVFAVTLAKSAERVTNNVQDVTVTFATDLKDETDKLQDFASANLVDASTIALADTVAGPIDVKDKYNAITESNVVGTGKGLASAITSGITISKVIIKTKYDVSTKMIVFTVTLTKAGEIVANNVQDVTVTFAEDLELEKNKLKDHFISQVDVADLGSANYNFKTAIVDSANIVEQYKLITEWNQVDTSTGDADESKALTGALASGTKISKVVIKTVYDAITYKIVFTVTLGKDDKVGANNVQEVTVTFAEDLELEKNKLQDFTSTDVIARAEIVTLETLEPDDGLTDVKDKYNIIVGAMAIGAGKGLASALTNGIEISKVTIKTKYDISAKTIVFIVTLKKGEDRVINNVKEVTVTFN